MGGIGFLPGMWSPASSVCFRAAFHKNECSILTIMRMRICLQFFHILDSVAMVRGSATQLKEGRMTLPLMLVA